MSPMPIRAIVGRFSFDFSRAALEKAMEKHPFEFAGIIAQGAEPIWLKGIPESSQEWFDSGEVRAAHYEGVDFTKLAPLDEELIENMRECEAVFMEMVRRLEWKYELSYETRKQFYFTHLRFWNDYLDRNRINLYIAAWLPHEMPDIVIYHLCKYKKIPVLYFNMSTEHDTQFAEHDIEENSIQIKYRYEELLKEYAGVTDPAQIPLRPEREERFQALIAREGARPALEGLKPVTYWMKLRKFILTKPLEFTKVVLGYLTPKGIGRAISTWKRRKGIKARNAFYNDHAIEPDMTKPFVYLALHFQPEASTVPLAGVFANQILMAHMLNAYLPDDALIYVKEHPKESSHVMRSIAYYQELLSIPKVRLMKRHVNTFALREHCKAVASATGSVGMEAIFRGKPVFIFGSRFYQYARGVFHVRTHEEVKKAVEEIFVRGVKPTLVESKLFLKAMDETCIHGTLVPWDLKVSKLTPEEHLKNNSEGIANELAELQSQIAAVS